MLTKKPIYVVADDFSGASEIAGIGLRYGLSARVLTRPNLSQASDLTVINSDTRSRSVSETKKIIKNICDEIQNRNIPFYLFKKIDSVLRGHILEEASLMMEHLGFNRVLLVPANPSKGRIIRDGQYFIEGKPLHNTPFVRDPEFPRKTSRISALLNSNLLEVSHRHVLPEDTWPDAGIFSVDIAGSRDLEKHIKNLRPNDLCSGAADAFTMFLERLNLANESGFKPGPLQSGGFSIMINGSAFRSKGEEEMLLKYKIPVFTLYQHLAGEQDLQSLAAGIIEELESNSIVQVKAGLSSIDKVSYASRIEAVFGQLTVHLLDALNGRPFHLFLTGGATATSIIDRLGYTLFEAVEELSPGVVTLAPDGINGLITTKPGSYPWPSAMFDKKINH